MPALLDTYFQYLSFITMSKNWCVQYIQYLNIDDKHKLTNIIYESFTCILKTSYVGYMGVF